MKDTNEIVKLIEAANAVPSTRSLPTGAYSSRDILARIDERYIMSDTKTRTPQSRLPDGTARNWSYRGPLIALVSAVAGVLIFFGLTNLRPGEGPPVVGSSPTTIAESTGPRIIVDRAQRALVAGTPLLETVDVFQRRFDAGDVEGYEAIFHPDAGYPSGRDAEAAWFGAVTGMTHERDCEVVAETQVRCVERSGSGLEPGTFSDEFVTVWNGADGYIWSIDFPEGTPPVEFSDPSDSPGVETYRQFVESNAPEMFADLFDENLAMRLDTEAVRVAHHELIGRFLADTTG